MSSARWPSALGAILLLFSVAQPAETAETLTLASGPADSRAYAASVGLASLIKFKLLPSQKIDLQAVNSSGAVDNVRRLQADDAQFAILPSAVGHAARIGSGSFSGHAPETGFRAIATLWRDALHLVMRADDVATGTIDDLRLLKDGKILLGDMSAGMIDANHLLLTDLGMVSAETVDSTWIDGGDGISAIKQGKVDVFSAAVRPPEAAFADLFSQPTSTLRLLDVTERQLAEVNGNHWLWTPFNIPAATYPGQEEDVWTMALSTMLVVRADVDADVVHAITESMFENLAYLERVDPVLADLKLASALTGVSMPLHPGLFAIIVKPAWSRRRRPFRAAHRQFRRDLMSNTRTRTLPMAGRRV